ncbi:MAG TPA: response regulator transcription factor [Anaerolineales bacterium]|nr:response regulator transcription factor [Anaerolineales bacterium]
MPAIKIIALDDHQLYLEGIRTALAREPDMHLAGAGRAAADLKPLLKTHYPDIALIDLHIPGFDGPRTIRRCVERYPKTRFVALTGSRDEALVRRVAQSGGSGYLLKESILGDGFADLLRRIHAGTVLFDEAVVHALIRMYDIELSARERECLALLSQGLTNAGIAEVLGLSPKRVANVLTGLYSKLDIDGLNEGRWVTRVVAVREAIDRGLVCVSEPRIVEYK